MCRERPSNGHANATSHEDVHHTIMKNADVQEVFHHMVINMLI